MTAKTNKNDILASKKRMSYFAEVYHFTTSKRVEVINIGNDLSLDQIQKNQACQWSVAQWIA